MALYIIKTLIDFLRFVVTITIIYFKEFFKLIFPSKPKPLCGEVILVTGAAGGLGQEICKQLVTSGAKLVLWDVCRDKTKQVAQVLKSLGAHYVIDDCVDITNREEIRTAAARVRKSVGPPTVLINNAGIAPTFNFLDLSSSDIEKTLQVNLISQFWTIQEFLPEMIKLKAGHIVTIASTLSYLPFRGSAPYVASKHAVHGMIECLKDELASNQCDFIKFSTIYPFFIKTPLLNTSVEKGFKLTFKYPWITPWLEVPQVAREVINAVVYQKEFVYLPTLIGLFAYINPHLPTKVTHAILSFLVKELNIPKQG